MGHTYRTGEKIEKEKTELKPNNTFEEVDLTVINPKLEVYTKDIKVFYDLTKIEQTLTLWKTKYSDLNSDINPGIYNGDPEEEYEYKTTYSLKTLALLHGTEILFFISPTRGKKRHLGRELKKYKDGILYREGLVLNYSYSPSYKDVITFSELLDAANKYRESEERAEREEQKKLQQQNDIPKGYDQIFGR